MKIGLLHYTMPPVIGGVERVLAAHTRLFQANGNEVLLFSSENVPGFGGWGDLEENREAFVQYIVAQKLDILFVHNVLTMPFCAVATAACHVLAASDLPVVSWVHDLAATNPYYAISSDNLLRKHPAGAIVVAISEERAAAYRGVTGHQEVKVVPNGLDAFEEVAGALFAKKPELRGILDGAFPILFHPTRVLRRKNIGLGIRVVAELKKLGLFPRLLISGATEAFSGNQETYRYELNALIAKLDVGQEVLFLADTSPLSEADVSQLYSLADALFFPSEQEGFGLPILEAGARGLPMFASQTQPLSHLAAQTGGVFPLDLSPTALALQMADFFSRNPSSQVRHIVRRDFDWQGIYQKHILPLLPT